MLRPAIALRTPSFKLRSHSIVFSNARVRLVCTVADAAGHDKPQHPETAGRVVALREAIAQHCLDKEPDITMQKQPQLAASDVDQLQQVLQLVHPASYLVRLQEICSSLQAPAMIDDSTYISPGSFNACCEVGCSSFVTPFVPKPAWWLPRHDPVTPDDHHNTHNPRHVHEHERVAVALSCNGFCVLGADSSSGPGCAGCSAASRPTAEPTATAAAAAHHGFLHGSTPRTPCQGQQAYGLWPHQLHRSGSTVCTAAASHQQGTRATW